MAEPIEIPFRLLAWVDPWKNILDEVYMGATWQTGLNCMCSSDAAFFVKLVWPLVITCH